MASGYLFERLQDFLSLAEVSEEQVQGSGHQRRVVVHGQVKEDPQEGPAPVVIQVQWRVLFTRITVKTPTVLQKHDSIS